MEDCHHRAKNHPTARAYNNAYLASRNDVSEHCRALVTDRRLTCKAFIGSELPQTCCKPTHKRLRQRHSLQLPGRSESPDWRRRAAEPQPVANLCGEIPQQ
jgi:hypothetical protein